MLFTLSLFLIIAEGIWQIYVNFPPTIEQLNLGVTSSVVLWIVRVLSLVMVVGAAFIFSSNLNTKIKKYYWIFILACPTISYVWMAYPFDALKLFVISIVFYFVTKKDANIFIVLGFGLVLISLLNIYVFKQKPEILKVLSFAQPQQEVNFRYQIEDNLNPDIHIPRLLKRVVYNKVFFATRDFSNLALTFIDFESLFFQEVHPMGAKSFVIFFWPLIFILFASIWLGATNKISLTKGEVILLYFSFFYFMTTDVSVERRFILLLFPLSIIFAKSIYYYLSTNSKVAKLVIGLLIILTTYGWFTNYFDRYMRPMYWLDNRPVVYDFILSNLKNTTTNYDQIIVPNTLFALNDYCEFYLTTCPEFKYQDFNLQIEPISGNTLYIGFVGNFVGPNKDNAFSTNYEKEIIGRNLDILYKTDVRNNIANTFGQTLLIVQRKK